MALRVLNVRRMLEEKPPAPAEGVIYFAFAEGTRYFKVGWTAHEPMRGSLWTSALRRLRDLQTGCPHRLLLFRVEEGSAKDEDRWHHVLAPARVHGEWFDADRVGDDFHVHAALVHFLTARRKEVA